MPEEASDQEETPAPKKRRRPSDVEHLVTERDELKAETEANREEIARLRKAVMLKDEKVNQVTQQVGGFVKKIEKQEKELEEARNTIRTQIGEFKDRRDQAETEVAEAQSEMATYSGLTAKQVAILTAAEKSYDTMERMRKKMGLGEGSYREWIELSIASKAIDGMHGGKDDSKVETALNAILEELREERRQKDRDAKEDARWAALIGEIQKLQPQESTSTQSDRSERVKELLEEVRQAKKIVAEFGGSGGGADDKEAWKRGQIDRVLNFVEEQVPDLIGMAAGNPNSPPPESAQQQAQFQAIKMKGSSLEAEVFQAAVPGYVTANKGIWKGDVPEVGPDGTIVFPPLYAEDAKKAMTGKNITYVEHDGWVVTHPKDATAAGSIADALPDRSKKTEEPSNASPPSNGQ